MQADGGNESVTTPSRATARAYATTPMSVTPSLTRRKNIALIAHDNLKADLLDWARYNRETLAKHELHATGSTGALIAETLGLERTKSAVARLHAIGML